MEVVAGGLRCRGGVKRSREGTPLISVVIAVLNRRDYIGKAIESVALQSYENIELIIIDGGSDDGTIEVLKQYDLQIDYWISEPDNGIYDALNKGIKQANGDWINIQGSDDFLYDSISVVAAHLVSDDVIYYGDLFYKYQQKIKFGILTRYQLANYRFGHHRFFFPKKYFKEYSYNTKYRCCADYEMFVRSFCDGRYAYEYVPVVIASYNECDGASSIQIDHAYNRDRFRFLVKHFPFIYVAIFYLRIFLHRCIKGFSCKHALQAILVLINCGLFYRFMCCLPAHDIRC